LHSDIARTIMAKPATRTKLIAAAERIGKTLGRAARQVDRLRGRRPAARKATGRRSAAPVRRRRGTKAHLQTEATRRHDASAAAKAQHVSERATKKPPHRNQSR
jgi:hypothetical protein